MTLGAASPLMWGPVHWLYSAESPSGHYSSCVQYLSRPLPLGLQIGYEGNQASVYTFLPRPAEVASTGALSSSCLEVQGWKRGELM